VRVITLDADSYAPPPPLLISIVIVPVPDATIPPRHVEPFAIAAKYVPTIASEVVGKLTTLVPVT